MKKNNYDYVKMTEYLVRMGRIYFDIIPPKQMKEFLQHISDIYLWEGSPKHRAVTMEQYMYACNILSKYILITEGKGYHSLRSFESFEIIPTIPQVEASTTNEN